MKKLFLLLVLALALPMTVAAREMYVVVSNDGQTMTFYYDEAKSYRAGTIYYKRSEWKEAAETVTQVYFDRSMDLYYPQSTELWFCGFNKMGSIHGIEYLNTSEVTSMRSMFYECSSLRSLDVSQLVTRNVTNMKCMFYKCSGLYNLDVRNFEMGNVENVSQMFRGCSKITTLDLTDWNLGKVTDVSYMFFDCSELTTIYTEAGADWRDLPELNTSNAEKVEKMFKNCTKLKGGQGLLYNSDCTGISYANAGSHGYFTARERITIDGEQVKNGVQSMSCIKSGTVTYVASSDELVLNDAVIETDGDGLFAPNGVYITVFGNCSIKSKGNGITALGDAFLTNDGTLTIESSKSYGISFDDALEVSCANLNVKGKMGALDGRKRWSTNHDKEIMGYLAPRNTTITLESDRKPVVNNLGSIEGIDDKCFYSYLDYRLDPEQHTVVDNHYDIPVQNPFKIVCEEPEGYGVCLGGHLINSANCDDFRPQSLSSGSVSYDPDTHTLSMDNAQFDRLYYPSDELYGLSVELKDITVELKGNNTLAPILYSLDYEYGISMSDWRQQNDNSSLHYTIRSADADKPASLHFDCSFSLDTYQHTYVNFENVDINNDGRYACLYNNGMSNMQAVLTVDNSTINLGSASQCRDMGGFTSVVLRGCHFEDGFYYDTNEQVVKNLNGDMNMGPVRIVRDYETPTSIDTILQQPSPNTRHSESCYTLDGRRVAGQPAKPGVYVNKGRKVVVK